MSQAMKWTLAALFGLMPMSMLRAADATTVLNAESASLVSHAGPVRGALRLARPAGRAAVAVGRAVKPGRRVAWMARSAARGAGIVAKNKGKLWKAGIKARPFKKRVIIP